MIHVLGLAEAIAKTLVFPEATAQVYARYGRAGGMLSTGGRGRNVVAARSPDAANLTLVMMAAPVPALAVEFMRDFGDLTLFSKFTRYGETFANVFAKEFPANMSFRNALANLFDLLGDKSFARVIGPKFWLSQAGHRGHLRPNNVPEITVNLDVTGLAANIGFGDDVVLYFAHKNMAFFTAETKAAIAEEHRQHVVESAKAERDAVAKKYHRRVQTLLTVQEDALIEIAKLVNGVGFDELLDRELQKKGRLKVVDVKTITDPVIKALFEEGAEAAMRAYQEQVGEGEDEDE